MSVSRQDVVEAAGRMFASKGYHGTSMRDLGAELGLLGSSLYAHVSSKEALLVEIVERGAALFERSAEAALGADDPLRALISGHIDVVLDHQDEVQTFLNEAQFLGAEHRVRVLRARNTYEESFRQVFADRPDPKLTAIFTLSILNAIPRWYDPSRPLTRAELVDAILDQLRRAQPAAPR